MRAQQGKTPGGCALIRVERCALISAHPAGGVRASQGGTFRGTKPAGSLNSAWLPVVEIVKPLLRTAKEFSLGLLEPQDAVALLLEVRFDVPPPAAEALFDTRRRNLAWGERQPSKRRTEQYSNTVSCAFSMLGIELFDGVELFDVASNFST